VDPFLERFTPSLQVSTPPGQLQMTPHRWSGVSSTAVEDGLLDGDYVLIAFGPTGRFPFRAASLWFLPLNHLMVQLPHRLLQATEREIVKCTKRSCAM
jgi:hypothetical protein